MFSSTASIRTNFRISLQRDGKKECVCRTAENITLIYSNELLYSKRHQYIPPFRHYIVVSWWEGCPSTTITTACDMLSVLCYIYATPWNEMEQQLIMYFFTLQSVLTDNLWRSELLIKISLYYLCFQKNLQFIHL